MNFKEKLQTVLQKLKLWDKAKANQLTHEEWAQIVNSYEKEYQATLQDDLAAYHVEQQANVISPEQITQVQTILDGIINPMQSSATEEPGTEIMELELQQPRQQAISLSQVKVLCNLLLPYKAW